MKRRTLLKAAAAFPVTLLSGCAVYDDGVLRRVLRDRGDLPAGAASAASPASSSCAATAAPASPCGTASSSETRAAASEAGSAAALCWPRSETGVPTGTSAPWASPSRGSADDASVWRSAPDRSWQTGTGFPESSRTPRRPRDGSPPGVWSSSGASAPVGTERPSWSR